MALTAARTELNVSLVGEDETMRMLEDAKKRMAELEAKTRTLTGATQAQTDAAKAQQAAAGGVNSALGRMGAAIAGPLEGIGKLKESINKGIEIFGFLGMAVTGAINAFNFLVNAFDDSEEEAAKLERQMEQNKTETDRLRNATDALTSSLQRMKAATGQSAAVLAAERATLAELRGDTATANFERQGVAIEQTKAKIKELNDEETKREGERKLAAEQMAESMVKLASLQNKEAEALRQARKAKNDQIEKFDKDEAKNREQLFKAEAANLRILQSVERHRLNTAQQTRDSIDEANTSLRESLQLNKEILNQQLINLGKVDEVEGDDDDDDDGGGGAARPVVDETQQREEDWQKFMEQLSREIKDRADYERHLIEMQADHLERRRALMAEPKLFEEAQRMRTRIADELALLPQDVNEKAFAPLRAELEKNAKALDEFMASRVAVGDRAATTLEEEDAIVSAYEKQSEALEKLKGSVVDFADMHAKAFEQMRRDSLSGAVNDFTDALQQLGQTQAPVFEVVTKSLAGVSAQMEKFKGGQQTLTQAVIGSSAAIAGAVADKVDSVKVEAGIRALFETAMGFANLGNPAVAAGHFTAAAMFGLVAGGVIPAASKTGSNGNGGGQKAPATQRAAAQTSDMAGSAQGPITNIYNLNTGIVDGQSTAMAFRRAEMSARSTGMASAGGW